MGNIHGDTNESVRIGLEDKARNKDREWDKEKNRDWQKWWDDQNSKDRGWRSGENEKNRWWESDESRKNREWETGERSKERDWGSREKEKERGWESGERSKERDWNRGEREASERWKRGEREAGQEWESGERKAGQEWESGERAADRSHESGMQDKDIEAKRGMQERDIKAKADQARANQAMKGYRTGGALYDINAAGQSAEQPAPTRTPGVTQGSGAPRPMFGPADGLSQWEFNHQPTDFDKIPNDSSMRADAWKSGVDPLHGYLRENPDNPPIDNKLRLDLPNPRKTGMWSSPPLGHSLFPKKMTNQDWEEFDRGFEPQTPGPQRNDSYLHGDWSRSQLRPNESFLHGGYQNQPQGPQASRPNANPYGTSIGQQFVRPGSTAASSATMPQQFSRVAAARGAAGAAGKAVIGAAGGPVGLAAALVLQKAKEPAKKAGPITPFRPTEDYRPSLSSGTNARTQSGGAY